MFKFRFQKALDQKLKEEEQKKNELYHLRALLEEEKEKLQNIEKEIADFLIKYQEKKQGKLNIFELKSYEEYNLALKNRHGRQKEKVQNAQKNADDCEENYLEIRKERKIFEKLKEKKYNKYLEEEKKNEQKFIDELSNSIFNRSK